MIETRNELARFTELVTEDVPVVVRTMHAGVDLLLDIEDRDHVVGYRVYDLVVGWRRAAHRAGIYVASKTRHADRWKAFRADGAPIISTWIDEAGAGDSPDLGDLWRRCIEEASSAGALVIYREAEDVLKGGWIELGAALAAGVPVFAVGIDGFTIAHDSRVTHCASIDEAIGRARDVATADACPICDTAFRPDDLCQTDVELGTCHAECLAGSPLVDLETGDPLPDGTEWPKPFRYGD